MDNPLKKLEGFKFSETTVKQLYGFLVALAVWVIGKYVSPDMADKMIAAAPMVVGMLVMVIFGVDVAGLARQNAAKAPDDPGNV